MGFRYPSPRLVKSHRIYSIDEIARLFGRHKNTVGNWFKRGLPKIDSKRPILIRGQDLVEFLESRRKKTQRCGLAQMYCIRCRVPRDPAGAMAEYVPLTKTSGNLRGICPDCDLMMHRRSTLKKLSQLEGVLHISLAQPSAHITERGKPSLNCELDEVT